SRAGPLPRIRRILSSRTAGLGIAPRSVSCAPPGTATVKQHWTRPACDAFSKVAHTVLMVPGAASAGTWRWPVSAALAPAGTLTLSPAARGQFRALAMRADQVSSNSGSWLLSVHDTGSSAPGVATAFAGQVA